MITARGRTATVSFDGATVSVAPTRVARVGTGAQTTHYPVSRLAGVQLTEATRMLLGALTLIPSSGGAAHAHTGRIRMIAQGANDPNTVVFGRKASGEFAALHQAILATLG